MLNRFYNPPRISTNQSPGFNYYCCFWIYLICKWNLFKEAKTTLIPLIAHGNFYTPCFCVFSLVLSCRKLTLRPKILLALVGPASPLPLPLPWPVPSPSPSCWLSRGPSTHWPASVRWAVSRNSWAPKRVLLLSRPQASIAPTRATHPVYAPPGVAGAPPRVPNSRTNATSLIHIRRTCRFYFYIFFLDLQVDRTVGSVFF